VDLTWQLGEILKRCDQAPGISKYQAGQKWPVRHYVGGPLTDNLR